MAGDESEQQTRPRAPPEFTKPLERVTDRVLSLGDPGTCVDGEREEPDRQHEQAARPKDRTGPVGRDQEAREHAGSEVLRPGDGHLSKLSQRPIRFDGGRDPTID